MGVVCPAGGSTASFFEALHAGRTLLADLDQPWAPPPYNIGASVGEFGARERIPLRQLRRLGRLSQMAVVAASAALDQAKLSGCCSSVGTIIGTGLGALEHTVTFIAELLTHDPELANPALFPSSVMNVAAAHISMELGLQGYSTTVNHKEISAELAVQLAVNVLRLGRVKAVVSGGVDELSWPAHHGYRRLGALAKGRPRPYRNGRDGMALAEGACMLVLEEVEEAHRRGAPILAHVAGIGATGGPRPLISWGPVWEGNQIVGPAAEDGARALRMALAEAKLLPDEVDLVIGCGCGSPGLDCLEAHVLAEVFGARPVPVTSVHGTLGTYMASGGLRLAAGVGAIIEKKFYPTVTEGEPDPGTPVPGLITELQQRPAEVVLTCSLATGGGNVAVVLTKGDE